MSTTLLNTSIRLYEEDPVEAKAYKYLKQMCREQHMSYSKAIAVAVNAYCSEQSGRHVFDANECEQIRTIVREELSVSAMSVNTLMQALERMNMPEEVAENYEADEEDIDEAVNCFGF